ncbi:MAG: protein-L-isoaspartate(D-aspartate) O-methyltransferase [Candidatus Promineifilaceae bacterium]|jgi:protein-L-isoaspartate(D-aspartate) O-methyltransferase
MIDNSDEFTQKRERMVREQIAGRGIEDTAVLRAMRIVPREIFVPERYRRYAYDDTPLPIPGKQTISQPYVVALMISRLELDADDCVLEIGTGSGYAAALLGQIVREVHTVERIMELVKYARERLELLGYDNIHVHRGDGTLGWEPEAPYDGIIVAAGGPSVPDSLKRQLAENGRLIIPVGRSERQQNLIRVIKSGEDNFEESDLGAVAFVPLIGDEGW